mgnify:CR=1 FL=1
MFNNKTINKFQQLATPFYYYDLDVLKETLNSLLINSDDGNFKIHYALKANANNKILEIISHKGLGADCVSGNEIKKAVETGFNPSDIVFAGVGKSDEEIITGINTGISYFNCESLQELQTINELGKGNNKIVNVALRINPNIDAKTHYYITTGLEENKFGISQNELNEITNNFSNFNNLKFTGLHFHIGSQITDLEVFKSLCIRINELQRWFADRGLSFNHINVGGGLGVDYVNVNEKSLPDFKGYFNIFKELLEIHPEQKVHFELGRAIVANCGSLISKVLYIKRGATIKFVILDAGMTELIRPALYQSYHKIENLSSEETEEIYDVVGPICESSDVFGKAASLPFTNRGDLIAIRSTGAYGETMSSSYNLRDKAEHYYSDEIE